MSILVGNGSAAIPTGTYPDSYSYFVATDTSGGKSVTITTANTSNPRIDVIVAYVNKSATASTSPVNNPAMLVFAAVAGTPASSPAVPSGSAIQTAIGASNPYIVLCQVAVGANVTQILNSNLTDVRPWASVSTANLTAPCNFFVYRNASYVNVDANSVPFDTKLYDTGNNVDIVTNVGRFTAPVQGRYGFSANLIWSFAASAQNVQCFLQKNGSDYIRGLAHVITWNASADEGADLPYIEIPLNAGDYINIRGVASSVGMNVGNAPIQSWFSGRLVSRT